MIHDGVRITLLIIVAAQTLIERRDEGFVFLGQWILLSCGSLIFLVTPSTSRTKPASFWNCFGNFPKENLRSDNFSCIMGFISPSGSMKQKIQQCKLLLRTCKANVVVTYCDLRYNGINKVKEDFIWNFQKRLLV